MKPVILLSPLEKFLTRGMEKESIRLKLHLEKAEKPRFETRLSTPEVIFFLKLLYSINITCPLNLKND